MKAYSIQFKFLITVISAILAIAVFVGGLSIYEVDRFVRIQTQNLIDATCEKEAAEINSIFGDMEKSVKIIESYVLALVESSGGIANLDNQNKIIESTDEMFVDVAKHTDSVVAYYLRLPPEIAGSQAGLFYSKPDGSDEYIRLDPTDLSLYDKDDTERVGWFWQPYEAGEPVWMQPYHNLNNDILMISYVVPLYYENRFIGVVGMDFDYTTLINRVHEIKIYEHGFAHLEVDGVVIHRSDDEADSGDGDGSDQYLRVSQELMNGMTLVLSASHDDIRQIRYEIAFKLLAVVLVVTLLFTAVVVLVVQKIVDPLNKLTDASKKLSNGNYDVEIVQSDTYEIKLLSAAFENMTTHLREHEKHQRFLAYRDSLTGLRNTTAYKAWVTDFEKELQSNQIDFGVIVLDVNNLKEANDSHGHDAGNKLIVTAARIISTTFKRSPVFRIGGDEFVVILQNNDLNALEELIVKFDSECANTFVKTDSAEIAVSIAKGFARYDSGRDSQFADVFNRADDAMYENKRGMKTAPA